MTTEIHEVENNIQKLELMSYKIHTRGRQHTTQLLYLSTYTKCSNL